MSANAELEKVLERAAREADHVEGWESVLIVLKARLLPILEAGQAAKICVGDFADGGSEWGYLGEFASITEWLKRWDAALRAAMEAKP